MSGRKQLRDLAALERAAITQPPPIPPQLRGPANPETIAQLVAEMTDWDATYKRERRRRDADRARRNQVKVVA